ncbi:RagB/SusD family nutrient uptake outer membrane protein [Chryseobacterium sp. MFBS3-17]|uniref:RagB/SusD family nutrient uptake outer membrane protein n=1 Tax=Chryseobacterium sp. MFBS3-17 TaxID=2886689 RepID=UPI001D0DDBB5|nr:RagB/SusD family nutrient uptake outer membrane protein [Chryseobacterium sp. MFBS3-17]MCC2590308.1 RagB/SusD family nutrient uptake outer membrane protein [Chryseobacterium sp. MFBS3-17]
MKNKIKNIFKIILVSGWLFTSCSDWIETDFPQNQIATEQVFEDVQSANAALAGLYGNLWNSSLISGGYDGLGALLSSYTDDLTCFYADNGNGALDLYHNQQLSTNIMVDKVWTSTYQQIYMTNSIIHGTENSTTISSTEKNRIIGESLFIRTLLYFNLVQIFGDIPYTESIDYEYNRTLTKSTVSALLTKLEMDIEKAIELLPEEYRSAERIYVNKSTAMMLKAKLMLLSGKWQETETISKSLLQNPSYSLEGDVTKVFTKTNHGILWQLKPKNNGDATKEYTLYYFNNSIPNRYALTQDLFNNFSSQDLRLQHWISTITVNQNNYYRSMKYKNAAGNTTEYSVVFRIAELYYILAESLIKQNKLTEAISYLNVIRTRAGLPLLSTNLSASQILQELQVDKRREFFAEMGHRFFDLKRWGLLPNLQNIKPNWQTHHKVWPLPQSELLLNSNLNPQNEGY